MSTYPDLLPPNSTPLERAVTGPTGRLTAIPADLDKVFHWETCPAEFLPWLAWELSVDIWDHDWPESRKRAIIREAIELHRKKGTLYAIRRYLTYADCKLRRAILPPDTAFAGKRITEDERERWLARFPQLRIYFYRNAGTQTYGAHVKGGYKLGGLFPGDQSGNAAFFPYQTDALERWGPRAFLWDKGTHPLATGLETKCRWIERTKVVNNETVYDYEQVLIPGSAVQSFFAGEVANYKGRIFILDSAANSRVVSIATNQQIKTESDVLAQKTVYPSLEKINAFPEYKAIQGTSYLGRHMFAGMRGRWLNPETKERKRITGFLQGYVPESTAPLRLFKVFYLHDPLRRPDPGKLDSMYAGKFRLGLPAFHAILSVEVQSKRPAKEFGRFVWGFASDGKNSRLNMARTAVVRAKAARDKVLLKTKLHRTISTSDGLLSDGSHRTNDLIIDL